MGKSRAFQTDFWNLKRHLRHLLQGGRNFRCSAQPKQHELANRGARQNQQRAKLLFRPSYAWVECSTEILKVLIEAFCKFADGNAWCSCAWGVFRILFYHTGFLHATFTVNGSKESLPACVWNVSVVELQWFYNTALSLSGIIFKYILCRLWYKFHLFTLSISSFTDL